MEKVLLIRYKCKYCGHLYEKEVSCLKHEEQCAYISKATELWNKGKTILEINQTLHLWKDVPENLQNCTKENCYYEYVDRFEIETQIASITGFTKSGIKITNDNNYTMLYSLGHVKNYIKLKNVK